MKLDHMLYQFDTMGYCVVKNAIPDKEREGLLSCWDEWSGGAKSFDFNFSWLNVAETIGTMLQNQDQFLRRVLGSKYRIDHAFGCTEKFFSTHSSLHHTSHMIEPGIIFCSRKGKPYTNLLTASVALSEVPPGKGGFCCIPGSHRSEVEVPEDLYRITKDHPMSMQIPQPAGSVLFFTEALTHGTYPFAHSAQRRSILIRLIPGNVTYRKDPDATEREYLPTLFADVDRSLPLPRCSSNTFLRRLLRSLPGK